MRLRWAVTALAVAAVSAALPGGSASYAAGCAAMTVDYAVPHGIVLSPPSVTIGYGGCVIFSNQTATTAHISVGSGYGVDLGFGESTSGSRNYVGRESGRQPVTATSGPASAQGTVVVGPAPTPAPSTRTPSTAPSATSSTGRSPRPRATQSSATARRRGAHPAVTLSPSVTRRLRSSAGVAPTLAPSAPSASPSRSPAPVVAAGPVEPPSGREFGLPAALAALAVIGTAGALLRVLLAEPVTPVERRGTVGGTP